MATKKKTPVTKKALERQIKKATKELDAFRALHQKTAEQQFRSGSHPVKNAVTYGKPDANAFKEINGTTKLIPAGKEPPIEKVTSIDRKKSTRITIPKNHRAVIYAPGGRFLSQTMDLLLKDLAIPSRYNLSEVKEPAPRLTPTDLASDFCRKICEEYTISQQNKIILELISVMKNRRELHANRAENNLKEATANRDRKTMELDALERILRGDFYKLDLDGE